MFSKSIFAFSIVAMMNLAVSVLAVRYSFGNTVHSVTSTAVQEGGVAAEPASHGVATASEGLQMTTSTTFVDMPGLRSVQEPCDRPGDLVVLFSAEAETSGGAALSVRCLVDTRVAIPSEVVIIRGTVNPECRAMNFVVPNIAPGAHTVRIQWRRIGGSAVQVSGRSLAVLHLDR